MTVGLARLPQNRVVLVGYAKVEGPCTNATEILMLDFTISQDHMVH